MEQQEACNNVEGGSLVFFEQTVDYLHTNVFGIRIKKAALQELLGASRNIVLRLGEFLAALGCQA